uniref:Uncharacterized protein n=1 Tax=Alexandrium catenella TaxID=2925 RepID=A0A7S1L5J9_ALECA
MAAAGEDFKDRQKSKLEGMSSKTISGKSSSTSKAQTAKMTGAIKLDMAEEDTNYSGRLLIFDTDKTELGRVDLPSHYRQGHRECARFEPQVFKDYLTEKLGFTVLDVYYKVRDHKKGVLIIRYAKLGESDKAPRWPFVAGMKLFVHGEAGKYPLILQRSPSTTWSQTSTADSSNLGTGCAIM